jgi:hypothetical protein
VFARGQGLPCDAEENSMIHFKPAMAGVVLALALAASPMDYSM